MYVKRQNLEQIGNSRKFFLLLSSFFLLFIQFSQAQTDTLPKRDTVIKTNEIKTHDIRFNENRLIYRKEYTGGAFIHTRGWGLNYRAAKNLNATQKLFQNFELLFIKHPKEYKISSYDRNASNYVYGKKNSLSIFAYSYGYQKILYEKEETKGVQISVNYSAGPSIGFVKPVYLVIAYPNVGQNALKLIEAYDETKQTQAQIYGKAPFIYGIEKTKLYPALNAKISFNFEYNNDDAFIRSLEIGGRLDAFLKEVPMMAYANNYQFLFNLFIHWQFGKKIE